MSILEFSISIICEGMNELSAYLLNNLMCLEEAALCWRRETELRWWQKYPDDWALQPAALPPLPLPSARPHASRLTAQTATALRNLWAWPILAAFSRTLGFSFSHCSVLYIAYPTAQKAYRIYHLKKLRRISS